VLCCVQQCTTRNVGQCRMADGRPAEYRWRPLFNAAVWLTPTTTVPCSNAAKTGKPLKFAGVPQTRQQISAASRPKFTILWGHVSWSLTSLFSTNMAISETSEDMWGRQCCLTSFFPIVDTCLSCEGIVQQSLRWCPDGDFLRHFYVLYFQRAACGIFQTCILNSH